MTRSSCALAMLSLCVWPQAARAFSDVGVFAQPALEGGGAGRYFTGSPRDGHSCSVCHEGGRAPEITISGLPERLVPGKRSEVSIRWRGASVSHALHLELATKAGAHANLELPDLETLPARQRCEEREAGEPAVFAIDDGPRRVLGVTDCGASELRFAFTAPEDVRELYFSLGMVRSDGSGTPDGDGVLEIRKRLTRSGDASAGCNAVSRATGRAPAGLLLLAWLALCMRRRAVRVACASLCVCFASACFQPAFQAGPSRQRDAATPQLEEFEDIVQASGAGRDRAAHSCGERPAATSRVLSVSIRTISAEGRYRPRNVGAIWIEDDAGNWIKTLEKWGTRRAKWLSAFDEASAGDVTDAVTGATLSTHRVHEVTWDLTDRASCEVDDGDYRLRMEMTDWSGTGPNTTVAFEKGSREVELSPPDQPPFLDIAVRLE